VHAIGGVDVVLDEQRDAVERSGTRPAFRSASRSSAILIASGFRSITELIAGPLLSIASIRAR